MLEAFFSMRLSVLSDASSDATCFSSMLLKYRAILRIVCDVMLCYMMLCDAIGWQLDMMAEHLCRQEENKCNGVQRALSS